MPVRVVNALFGANPYFVTDTGATYNLGSMLPDGAEVVAILPTKILFRSGDQIVTYPLDSAPPLAKP